MQVQACQPQNVAAVKGCKSSCCKPAAGIGWYISLCCGTMIVQMLLCCAREVDSGVPSKAQYLVFML